MRRGVVLLVVLVVIAMLSLACLTFSELMRVEHAAARVSIDQAQARALAESGLEMARVFMLKDDQQQEELGGWYDNPDVFSVPVIDDEDPRSRGRVAIVAPLVEDGLYQGIRFGLEDESTRLNLNTLMLLDDKVEGAGREILMGLPGMTEDVADAILDWIDEDDEPRELGAEKEDYAALDAPYAPKNGPLETVEELLLVRDVTPWLLFGSDANRNGYQDPGEPDAENFEDVDNAEGVMNRGWSAYLTLYSMELNVRPDGQPKIDLNMEDLEELYDQLKEAVGEEYATFVVAFRQNGPYTGSKKPTKTGGRLDLSKPSKYEFKQTILELIGPNVEVTFKGDKEATVLETPFSDVPMGMNLYLPILMDNVTINASPLIPGRINVNQAPKTVLAGIPGMTDEILREIISEREPNPAEAETNRRHETWILSEELVTLEEMKSLIPFLTGGGNVYRAQAIGFFEQGGPAVRIEAVLDATAEPAKVLFYRDLSHLGRGYPKTILSVEALDW